MAPLHHTIETIINNNKLEDTTAFESFLRFASKGYGLGVTVKNRCIDRQWMPVSQLPCPILSIGNITSGGTGKTPLTLYTARFLSRHGYRIAIVSRGYKGGAEKTGGIVSDGQTLRMSAQEAGDEPYMMASELRDTPVLVGKDRFRSARQAIETFSSNVIILDDGFQHRKLGRTIDLLLVDHHRSFGNRCLLPRGPLREPLTSIGRAHAIIETRAPSGRPIGSDLQQTLRQIAPHLPVFQCEFRPFISDIIGEKSMPQTLDALKGTPVFCFSGLANNQNFYQTLEDLNFTMVGHREFPDHHWYDNTDVRTINDTAKRSQAKFLATTQKDAMRLGQKVRWTLPLVVFGITPHFGNQTDAFEQFIIDRLGDG